MGHLRLCKKWSVRKALGVLTQTEELLNKRRNLLEKKVNESLEKAKEFQRAKNTRGDPTF